MPATLKPKPGQSLAEVRPELAAEWHPRLNGDLTAYDVRPGSNAEVWWLCSRCGHEWQTKVFKRGTQGRGCPPCGIARRAASAAMPDPGESLAEIAPAIAAEWHPTRNGDLTSSDVRAGSGRTVWWLCAKCQYEWQTTVYRRAQGTGCRQCWFVRKAILRATPKPGNSFGELFPGPSAEWHPTLNGDLSPNDFKPGSHKRVWWQCAEGHVWEVSPSNRRRGERCPTCAELQRSITKSTPKAGQSLADLHVEIAADWHPSKNAPLAAGDVNPGSKTPRWWLCRTCAHEWRTDPDHRTRRGDGCPKCRYARLSRTKSTPKPGRSLAETHPTLAGEWHPTLNEGVAPFDVHARGRARAWWLCPNRHEWNALIAPRAEGVGCPKCSTIGVSERQVRLAFELAAAGLCVAHEHPPITVDGRRPIRADIVIPDQRVIVEYDGSYYHAKKGRADRVQTAALESAGWTVVRVRELPLFGLGGHEVFVSPVDPIKLVAIKTLKALSRIGYEIPRGDDYIGDLDEWGRSAADAALYRYRSKSLASEYPYVAEEFDPDKNNGIRPEEVHPGSNTEFIWTCRDCAYEWPSMVWIRTAGHGCPKCSRTRGAAKRALPLPGGSFADLFPEPAAEWHPTRNAPLTVREVRPASSKLVWWQCQRGHVWQARVADRRKYGRCRKCRANGQR